MNTPRLFTTPRVLLSAVLLAFAALGAPAAHAQQQPAGADTSEALLEEAMPPGQVVDGIAAVVGDEIILRSEVDALVANTLQRQEAAGQSAGYSSALWMDALNELINQKVLSEEAERDTTIRATEEQVQQALDQRIEGIIAQAGSQERVEELYGKSVIQLKDDFRDDFREQLLAEQLQGRKLRSIDITPSEVREWFEAIPQDSLPELPETVRLAHIVRYPQASEEEREEAREIITAIRDSIVAGGAAFEEMARQFSDDPGSASSGGRIEGAQLSALFPEFAAVAARVPVGEVSQPFTTPLGYHIVRVNARQGNTVDFNHVLIRIDDSEADPTEAIEYLRAVRDSLDEYEVPFELMARRHSEEEASSRLGGRVVAPRTGTRDLVLSALGPSWRGTISGLEEGEISQPTEVELLDGRRAYHIVKLQQRLPAHRVSLKTDYDRIKEFALQEKRARALEEWIAKLREDIYVDIRVDPDDLTAAR